MSASRNLKGLLAGVAAVAVIGTAIAQGNPPNPAKKDAATGAGQQSSQQTPMGTTGTPGGSTASGSTSSGSTASGSTSGSSSSNTGSASSGSTGSGSSMGSSSTASDTSGTGSSSRRATRTARADRN